MKIKCTRDSRWSNEKGGGPQSFKQDQVLVVGEDVNEFRAEDMLHCDYAEKVGEAIVKETKTSDETTVKDASPEKTEASKPPQEEVKEAKKETKEAGKEEKSADKPKKKEVSK